jgi:glyoxalase family protein
MGLSVHGIHHITAICGPPQENFDFYVGVLGLRLVKKTVNQDVPDTYHLFYADGVGNPGTDLTFFPWPQMAPARRGAGLAVEVALAVPVGSLSYWESRLEAHGVARSDQESRFGEATLPFRDPHGLELALVETDDERSWTPWQAGPVSPELQIRGIHAVRLLERELAPTAALLEASLGFEPLGEEVGWHRWVVDEGGSGCILDMRERPTGKRGAWGTGGVHHVAWRVEDVEEEMAVRDSVRAVGIRPTAVIDRFWFRSVYFREPGGVLLELATDGPGFQRDEALENLGETLILPPWLEPQRDEIESALPPLEVAASSD